MALRNGVICPCVKHKQLGTLKNRITHISNVILQMNVDNMNERLEK